MRQWSSSRDNWERLVGAVIKKQQLWEMFHSHSTSPSLTSLSSDDLSSITHHLSSSLESSPLPETASVYAPNSSSVSSEANTSIGFLKMKPFSRLYQRRKPKHHSIFKTIAMDDSKLYGQFMKFSLPQLEAATDNFSADNVVARGEFSRVYRGKLENGTLVAIRRIRNVKGNITKQEELKFKRETEIMSVAEEHSNLTNLLGFCTTRKERLLVYPLAVNGSIGSYFQVCGSLLHVAPEYLSGGHCSDKTDVYSYGVFLLEVISGLRISDLARAVKDEYMSLFDWVWRILNEDKYEEIVDRNLLNGSHISVRDDKGREMVKLLLQMSLICTNPSPEDRPMMSEVVTMLQDVDCLAER